jgi:hypothetical protein
MKCFMFENLLKLLIIYDFLNKIWVLCFFRTLQNFRIYKILGQFYDKKLDLKTF